MTDRPPLEAPSPSSADAARLRSLAAFLQRLRGSLRYVDYAQAEADCALLASKLRRLLSPEELAQCRFAGIPRGGLVVLGLLSYLLEIPQDRLQGESTGGGPWVWVDDCALTGSRLARELRRRGEGEVVFAHLYSHPELRRRIEAAEPRVRRCVAARDLSDLHETRPSGPERDAWEERWRRRGVSGRYWIGQPELVCFAWSEPDRPFWNPVMENLEDGWRFLPPHLCLANRRRLQVVPGDSPPPWRLSASVAWGDFDGRLWLCAVPRGEVFSLEGAGREILRLLLAMPDRAAVLAALQERYGVSPADVEPDVEELLDRLLTAGLLEKRDGEPG